ncbi:bifunctional diguanylate cyclase/phosphodiesterase [Caldinitratiruptor microaerophilus]|uniref:Diguanylate cyclase/phosphodiesterase n=1 Tax=Caldinitratiruptor microaerophilus TaxID=671077 RepID=A0AA35CK07_9FIRM|nr:bifunctional diguanylate cyclase/phosphodiesterase [Caldinitratiruptor microaerophilus]BDG60705.1 hypothetical protein caldi_17950 [Caldinitratiruptor microaerophilus]
MMLRDLFPLRWSAATGTPHANGTLTPGSDGAQAGTGCDRPPEDPLQAILDRQEIHTVFQPILDLRSGHVAGHEALARGPRGPLESPGALFQAAEASGRTVDLDLLCIRTALAVRGALGGGTGRLLLNVHPLTVRDPERLLETLLSAVRGAGVKPRHVVLEITERAAGATGESFRSVVGRLRQRGFKIAVDDLGAGYSNLATVASLHPDLIKLDRSLIRDVHRDDTRRKVVQALVELAHRMSAQVVAEGIEALPELEHLVDLGVDLGQGFLVGRPALEPGEPEARVVDAVRRRAVTGNKAGQDITLGEVAVQVPTVSRVARLADVLPLLERPDSDGVLVVTDPDGRPEGILVRHQVFQRLGSQYGYAVFMHRPVDLVVEEAPVMQAGTPLVAVAQSVAARREQLDDYVLVVDAAGRFQGVLSSRRLLDRIAQIHIDIAKHANPLTGLPGNLRIEAELGRRIQAGEPMTVIYADIDRFKLINDCLGFAYGDQVIRILGQILQDAVAAVGTPDDFVGHIGGDDFIVITRSADAERLCRWIAGRFDAAVGSNRGAPGSDAPVPTVSLAVVSNLDHPFGSVLELARIAAVAKRRAKERRVRTSSTEREDLNDLPV